MSPYRPSSRPALGRRTRPLRNLCRSRDGTTPSSSSSSETCSRSRTRSSLMTSSRASQNRLRSSSTPTKRFLSATCNVRTKCANSGPLSAPTPLLHATSAFSRRSGPTPSGSPATVTGTRSGVSTSAPLCGKSSWTGGRTARAGRRRSSFSVSPSSRRAAGSSQARTSSLGRRSSSVPSTLPSTAASTLRRSSTTSQAPSPPARPPGRRPPCVSPTCCCPTSRSPRLVRSRASCLTSPATPSMRRTHLPRGTRSCACGSFALSRALSTLAHTSCASRPSSCSWKVCALGSRTTSMSARRTSTRQMYVPHISLHILPY